ncbi:MAG: response regulator [Magnetococcales bacterium]|nr:response regulator [Magnetococcales bacterium]
MLVYTDIKVKKEREEGRALLEVWESTWVAAYRGFYGSEGMEMEAMVGKWQELSGYAAERFLGQNPLSFQQLIDPRDLGKVKEGLQLVVEDRQPATLVYRLNTSQGRERWVMDYVQALGEDVLGRLPLVGCLVDITSVMIQHELEVGQKDQLQGEVERYQEMVAEVGHKIRSQITLLQGRLDMGASLLKERGGSPLLSHVITTCHQLEQTGQEMLEAMYPSSRTILQPAMVVRQIVDEENHEWNEYSITKKLQLEIAWYGWYEGQATLFRRAVRQGLAMVIHQQEEEGVVLVQGGVISVEEKQVWLSLHLSRQEESVPPNAFPDWQVASMKGVMEDLAGRMQVDEGYGGISLLFPMQVVPFAHGYKVLNPPERIPELNLLLAEDDLALQDMLSEMLEQEGHQVSVVGNGREVLAELADKSYDLVIMDVAMPEMSGLQATWQIRHGLSTKLAELPVLVLTADLSEVTLRQCFSVGVDGIVAKPVEMERLTQVMAQVLVARGNLAPAPLTGMADSGNHLQVVNGLQLAVVRRYRGQQYLLSTSRKMVKDGEEFVGLLQKAAREGNRQEARRLAHLLYGVTSTLGLDRVACVAKKLELDLSDLSEEQWFARLALLEEELGRATDQLVRMVEDQ